MFFEKEDFYVTNVQAVDLSWLGARRRVAGRAYDALAFRVAGTGDFRFPDGQTLHTGAGEILYLPAGLSYDVTYSDGRIFVFHFRSNAAGQAARFVPEDPVAAEALFARACRTTEEDLPGARERTCALLYEVLASLRRTEPDTVKTSAPFRRACALLWGNFSDPDLTVAGVCRAAFLSPSAFRRTYRALYGKSPIDDLTDRRLRRAEQLLLATGDSVEEIAAACGFSDAKYFCRVMHRKRGYPPSALRHAVPRPGPYPQKVTF